MLSFTSLDIKSYFYSRQVCMCVGEPSPVCASPYMQVLYHPFLNMLSFLVLRKTDLKVVI